MAFFNFALFCATLLFTSITLALPIAQPPQSQLGDIFGVTTSPSPSTCVPVLLSWSGGAAPFTIQINEGGNIKQTLPLTQNRNAAFNVNSAGDVTAIIVDSTGRQTTSDLIRVSSNCSLSPAQPSSSSVADFSNSLSSGHPITVTPGMIAGLAIGGLVLVGIIVASIWWFCRLQRRAVKAAAADDAANERDAEWSHSRPRPEVSSDDSSSVTLGRSATPPSKESKLGPLKVIIPCRNDPTTIAEQGLDEVGVKEKPKRSMSSDTSTLGRSTGNAWRAADSLDSPPESAGRTRSSVVMDSRLFSPSKPSQGRPPQSFDGENTGAKGVNR